MDGPRRRRPAPGTVRLSGVVFPSTDPGYMSRKIESFERINSIRETNGNFDSCNSCKRLGTSRLHELHESKFLFVSRIEFIRSKLSNFSAHVSGVTDRPDSRLTSLSRPVSEAVWSATPFASASKHANLERIQMIRKINGTFDSCMMS